MTDSDEEVCFEVDEDSSSANPSTSSDDDESLDTLSSKDIKRTYGSITVYVDKAKIAYAKVDVIVNSTSGDLDLTQGAASRSLLQRGGQAIQTECKIKYSNGIKAGEIAVTSAGSLNCKEIYHVVLPKWEGSKNKKVPETVVTSCLQTACQKGYKSIAFPALGTGNLGYDKSVVAKKMLAAVKKYAESNPTSSVTAVRFVIFPADVATYQAFSKACTRDSRAQMVDTGSNDGVLCDSPFKVSEDVEADSDESEEKTDTECRVKVHHITVSLKVGHLYDQQTDVVMMTTTRGLDLKKGTLSNSVLEAAGPALQAECKSKYPKGIQHGDIAVLNAANLPCKHVYCGSIPRCDRPEPGTDPKQLLSSLVKKCLDQAESDGMVSVSFPTLGTGYLMYPPADSAHIMLKAINDFASSNPGSSLNSVDIVILSKSSTKDKNLEPFKKVCESYRSLQSKPVPMPRLNVVGRMKAPSSLKPKLRPKTLEDDSENLFSLPARRNPFSLAFEPKLVLESRLQQPDRPSRIRPSVPAGRIKKSDAARQSLQSGPARGTQEFCTEMYSQEIKSPPYWSVFTQSKAIKNWKANLKGQEFYKLVDVDQTTFQNIEQLLASTWEPSKIGHGRDASGLGDLKFSAIKVTSVQRVENLHVYEQYCQRRQHLFHKAGEYGVFKKLSDLPNVQHGNSKVEKYIPKIWKSTLYPEVNEGFFFHGTKKENVQGVIKQGLDSRMGEGQAVFGRALYMAESSTKADQYTDSRGQRSRTGLQMFVMRVSLGDICLLKKERNLCRPPCLESDCDSDKCDHDKRYDSVVEEERYIFREFVVYDSHQVYPEFLITYDRV